MALIQQSLAFYICRRLDLERWQQVQWELSGANVQVGAPLSGRAADTDPLQHRIRALAADSVENCQVVKWR